MPRFQRPGDHIQRVGELLLQFVQPLRFAETEIIVWQEPQDQTRQGGENGVPCHKGHQKKSRHEKHAGQQDEKPQGVFRPGLQHQTVHCVNTGVLNPQQESVEKRHIAQPPLPGDVNHFPFALLDGELFELFVDPSLLLVPPDADQQVNREPGDGQRNREYEKK
ncbi:MAG TPA: hypothetical protein PLR20_07860 [Syntrophales bacterium]|nr:hypothetical protein [Syntrophales bacterium]HOX93687.1 hypothetical protein [Syntrophales bacterium]HPI56575.1 hypothetical protein [Syntrophales bacterium]HPN25004.1 hypothetical protein [Syntrophales bacterium]HQM29254.1 hypothetical protein [Syntrophales bacterium]